MARIITKKDQTYGYFRSGDAGYPIPSDCRDLIKKNLGEFNGDAKEWRVPLHRCSGLVVAIRTNGHTVVEPGSGQQIAKLSMLECAECRAPYPSASYSTGGPCKACGEPLRLEPTHECGPACAANARVANG